MVENYKLLKKIIKNSFIKLEDEGLIARIDGPCCYFCASDLLCKIMENKNAIGFAYILNREYCNISGCSGNIFIHYGGSKYWYNDKSTIPNNALTNFETGKLIREVLQKENRLDVEWNRNGNRAIKVSLRNEK